MLFVPRDSPGWSEAAQGLVEYALILLLVAMAVVVGLTVFGGALRDTYSRIITAFPEASSATVVRHML